jgi:filamentous hemagglutinin family protein
MRLRGGRAGPWGQTLAAVAVSSCFAAPALANPTGANVVRGTAAIHQAGNLLQITNSPNAIINWQSFSIGANEITRFIQQSPSSAVLNRVTTQNPSQILGTLQSRLADGLTRGGKVFLINPNGIVFGAGSQIDVGGLVASTLNMTDKDFLDGNLRFGDGLGKNLINQGEIATSSGGSVYLVGSAVTNQGIIRSPQGEVILAAGNSVELVSPGAPNLRVEVVAGDNAARNLGQVVADAGRVGIYAGLVTQSGTLRADSAVAEGGRIVLKATKNATLEAGSVTSASGVSGGSVTVQSGDTTLVAGAVEAAGATGKGGTIHALGNLVGVIGDANIDASGNTGGGTVLVGGDFQGKNPGVQNAYRTYLGPDAVIRADAAASGNGGKVIVWADDVTRVYGSVSAHGGTESGNGGFVEISGKGSLDFGARVNVGAANGATGTLLLDPQDIVISNTTTTDNNQLNANTPTGGDPAGAIFFGDSSGSAFTISDEALEAQTGNIVLQASRDITVNNNLSGGLNLVNQGAGERVVLQAGRDITIGSPISTAGAAIVLEADSVHSSSGAANGTGTLTINAAVTSNGGHITLIGGGNPILSGGGISLSENQTINAGAGGIDIALSGNASLGVGTLGLLTQILGNPMDELHTTGALRVGVATTAGDNGLGLNAQPLLANSVTNIFPGSAIDLSPATGTSFEIHAGSGGIVLDQPLTSFQGTVFNTPTGQLTINDPINTSDHNLRITALNVVIGANGSINTGTGTFDCTGVGCPAGTGLILWDGGGGPDKSWFNPLNWNVDTRIPTASDDVRIDSGFGTIVIGLSGAVAKSLIVNSSLEISGGGTLELANASQFTQQFTLAGGSLLGSGSAAVTGSSGSLTWSGGTMGPGGTFLLGSASSGTLSNILSLNRLFENQGSLTLSGATVGGSGSFANSGMLTAAAGTTNAINVPLVNVINTTLGTIQVNGMLAATSFPTNGGILNIGGAGALSTGGAALTNDTTGVIQAAGTLDLGPGGAFSNAGAATFDGAYNAFVTNISDGTLTFNGTASTGTLNFSGGTVNGTGDLTVATDFVHSGGTLGATFSDLVLNKSGNFTVGAAGITAVDSVKLIATGDVTLNGMVAATGGTGDAIVVAAGGNFFNSVGSSVLNPGSGRWLVYSTSPAGSFENGLTGAADPSMPRLYGRTYPGTVAESGSHLLYSERPTLTVAPDNKTKVYGADDPAQTYMGAGFVNDDGVIDTAAMAGLGGLFSRAAGESVGSRAITQGTFASSAGYQIAFTSGQTLTIGQAGLTASIGNQAKVYGADDPAASGIGVTADGLVNRTVSTWNGNVVVNDSGLTSSVVSLTRAVGENVGSYSILNGDFSAPSANYSAPVLTGGSTLTIAKADLTASIANQAKEFGTNDPAPGGIGVTVDGLVNRTVQTWNGNVIVNDSGLTSSVVSLTRDAGENAGSYSILSGAFSAPSSNYNAPVLTGSPTLAIERVALAVTADPQTKMFGAFDPTLSFQTSGLVSASVTDWNGHITAINDTAGTALTGSLARNSGETVGAYAINQGSLAAGNYTMGFTGSNLNITPDPGNFQWAASGGGSWNNPGNWNQGILPVANSVVTIPTSGPVTYDGGTTNLISIISSAPFSINAGILNLSGTGANASNFPSLTIGGGTLGATLGGNGTINASTLNVLAGGVLTGSRIVNGSVNNLGGVVAMGASPGTITINGDYLQGSGGTLQVEMAGTTAGSQYDQLIVNGNATLGGTLNVTLVNGYAPAGGETFSVVQSSGAMSGTFASTNFPAIPSFTAAYLPASVQLLASIPVPLGAVESASQVVIALTDQNQNTLVASQVTGLPVEMHDQQQQQEQEALQKTPMCNASSGGGGGGGGGLVGGGGFRCNTRGCF